MGPFSTGKVPAGCLNALTQQHKYYCGIDLHAQAMYVCILDQKGMVKVHQNIKTDPQLLFELIFPYLDDVVVGVECVFCWYRASPKATPDRLGGRSLCRAPHRVRPWPYIIHEGHPWGNTKNDKVDS
jgi:hypothetical protein